MSLTTFSIALALLAFAIHSLRFVQRLLQEQRRITISHWPLHWGTIQTHRIQEKVINQRNKHYEYTNELSYTYPHQGSTYTGNQIGPKAQKAPSQQAAQELDQQFQASDKIAVRVNPVNPGEALLTAGSPDLSWGFILRVCLLGIFIPALLLYGVYLYDQAVSHPASLLHFLPEDMTTD